MPLPSFFMMCCLIARTTLSFAFKGVQHEEVIRIVRVILLSQSRDVKVSFVNCETVVWFERFSPFLSALHENNACLKHRHNSSDIFIEFRTI